MRRWLLVLAVVAVSSGGFLAAPAGAGGGPHCPGMTDEATNTVGLAMNCFVPTITRIQAGEEVRFINKDAVPHTVTGTLLTWGDTSELDLRDEVSYRFDEDGIYPYTCIIHPGMVGAIVVGDGEGPTSGSVSYMPTGSDDSAATDTSEGGTVPTRATTDNPASSWSVLAAVALGVALLALATRRRIRSARTSIALTTKP